jgi:adhesin YadB/C
MGYSNNVSGSALQVIGSYNELDMVGMGAILGSETLLLITLVL